MENYEKSLEYLERARKVQPRALSVRSLEVILLSRTGKEPQALALARQAVADRLYDYDLANSAFLLGWRAGDFELATRAMGLRMAAYPENRAEGYVQLGNMYASGMQDTEKALGAFKQAMALASQAQRQALWPQVPPAYRSQLGTTTVPQPASPQTSASKG